jgi:hypothetical protein
VPEDEVDSPSSSVSKAAKTADRFPDETSERIYREETYRVQVREQIAKKADSKNSRGKFWEMLNSAFSLWFLSTIVVGSVTFFYTKCEHSREDARIASDRAIALQQERDLAIRKTDAEIASRLSYVHSLTRTQEVGADSLEKALLILENPSEGGYPVNVFPEYSRRSLRSLLWDLLRDLPANDDEQKDERLRIEAAYQRARLLPTLYVLLEKCKGVKPTLEGEEPCSGVRSNLGTIMANYFDLLRWDRPFTWEKAGKRIQPPAEPPSISKR